MKTKKDVKRIKVSLYFVSSGGGGGRGTQNKQRESDKQIKT